MPGVHFELEEGSADGAGPRPGLFPLWSAGLAAVHPTSAPGDTCWGLSCTKGGGQGLGKREAALWQGDPLLEAGDMRGDMSAGVLEGTVALSRHRGHPGSWPLSSSCRKGMVTEVEGKRRGRRCSCCAPVAPMGAAWALQRSAPGDTVALACGRSSSASGSSSSRICQGLSQSPTKPGGGAALLNCL